MIEEWKEDGYVCQACHKLVYLVGMLYFVFNLKLIKKCLQKDIFSFIIWGYTLKFIERGKLRMGCRIKELNTTRIPKNLVNLKKKEKHKCKLTKGELAMKALRLILILVVPALLYPKSELINFYKKNEIKIVADASFGIQTDWGGVLQDAYKGMTVAPEGAVFVVNTEQHNILKFDNGGNLVRKFGTQGQGDGELYYPNSLSILDGKYLVVGDLPQNCKFTIYDLNGTFKRVVKTGKTAYSPLALTDDKVAYLYKKRHYSRSGDEVEKEIVVLIKDIDTGKEIDVVSYFVPDVSIIHIPEKVRILIDAFFKGDVFITRAKGGNLLVGLSSSRDIDIYSPTGVKIGSFTLKKMKPTKVSDQFIEEFQNNIINKLSQRDYWPKYKTELLEKINDSKYFFDEYLPYYRELLVDSDGNILVFKERGTSHKSGRIEFQVYSPDGKRLIGETSLNMGNYKLDMDSLRWFRKIHFTDKGIFALLELKKGKDTSVRIVKVNPE